MTVHSAVMALIENYEKIRKGLKLPGTTGDGRGSLKNGTWWWKTGEPRPAARGERLSEIEFLHYSHPLLEVSGFTLGGVGLVGMICGVTGIISAPVAFLAGPALVYGGSKLWGAGAKVYEKAVELDNIQ